MSALYTAQDLATFCAVDLKTVHNWMHKMPIRHRRTAGGQVRFSRLELVDFLSGQGLPIPRSVKNVKPLVALVATSGAVRKLALSALGRRFQVHDHQDLFDALLAARPQDYEAIVLDPAGQSSDWTSLWKRAEAHPQLGPLRRIGFVSDVLHPSNNIFTSAIAHAAPGKLRAELERLLECGA